MTNYSKTTVGKETRVELHDKLALTGAEISLNELPAGTGVPFVHSPLTFFAPLSNPHDRPRHGRGRFSFAGASCGACCRCAAL